MSKILYVKANAKPEGVSRTFRVSDSFVTVYKKFNPNDEITTLDLYKEDIRFLNSDDINMSLNNVESGQFRNHPVFKYAYQLLDTDKIIIAAPFWNLSFPAILKAYLDCVAVGGITFKYTSEGPKGQCIGKKAIHFVTRGGAYTEEPLSAFELGDRYLRTLFAFLGITDFTTFALENMDRKSTNVEQVIEDAIKNTQELAKNF
ncbi:NAD(P)H-dependent oxidoreductase [Tissierella sp. Yu-01]|uniref:FMN-dependent NADH-azoreductase n=1 Tax=Tissierella sp. Yu-01 TaxID=3035694 RepID=UPI00240DF13A|nr:NAD(P)H-dependent oxidoreductase [Tissierella sp. Yu-01]WFA08905.1 NAD(P)H-dependent oxidoreductase [Tissierella sp. Yu-01]